MLSQFDKTSEHTASLIFVSKAVEKKNQAKPHLMNLYCDGSRVYATDGHRLHVYLPETCPLSEGYFKVLKQNKTSIDLVKTDESLVYPDIDRVIPKADKVSDFLPPKKYNGDSYGTAPSDVSGDLKLAQVLRAQSGGTFNIDYFLAACAGMGAYAQADEISPLLLTGKNRLAVVMPIRG